jgi:ribosomal protein L30/L7E
MNYDIILFNSTNNAPYQWMDDQSSQLRFKKRNHVVYRKDRDGVTGPESVWDSVFDQLNSALSLGWVNWGNINRQPTATSGDFSYGYGICIFGGGRADGLHGGSFILVDVNWASDPTAPTAIGLSEAFENICSVQNIGGNPSSMTIQYRGVLKPVGKDLFAYAFAKDSASK